MDFSRVTPESVGISSQAILNTLDAMDALGVEMHGIMLVRHGKVCAEGYWKPYNKKTPHIMFSFTKSLVSTAIGFARQEGLLSLDEKLVDLFPGKLHEHPSENLKKCQIYHLLVMGCGHETEPQIQRNPDWISAFLAHPFVYEPGTHFLYNSAGTNLLCAILQKKDGANLDRVFKSPPVRAPRHKRRILPRPARWHPNGRRRLLLNLGRHGTLCPVCVEQRSLGGKTAAELRLV